MRFCLFLLTAFLFLLPAGIHAAPPDAGLPRMVGECRREIAGQLQEERNVYRGVQYGETYRSVLGTTAAKTSDLVPYLVLNYHALSCRMRMFCDAVSQSHGYPGTGPILSHRPIGCSRLFSARGRWWSPDRRDAVFRAGPIEECAFGKKAADSGGDVTGTYGVLDLPMLCDEVVDQILFEEREMLRLLVAQDSAHRGTRTVIGVFQAVLQNIRGSFLEPLRGLADLFGSVLHPVPCLSTQCN